MRCADGYEHQPLHHQNPEGRGENHEQAIARLPPESQEEKRNRQAGHADCAGKESFQHKRLRLRVEDQAIDQASETGESDTCAPKREIDLRPDDQIDKEERVWERQDKEAEGAPEKKPGARSAISAPEKESAAERGYTAE